jgi:DNA-binding beta-propeller fold protein YncE
MPHDPLAAGLAVSHDDATVAVSDGNNHVVTLFSLGTNRRVTTIGGKGSGRGQLWGPRKLVFSADGILVAEWHNKRVQELTLAGEHVRFIGADVFTGKVHGVTANQDVIVASQPGCEQQIMVFSYRTGDFVKGFGLTGVKCQQLACCYAVQLTHDGRHVVVADWGNSKISIFRLAGQYVKCFLDEAALHLRKATDMCLSDEGEIVVANCESHRISPIFCGRELYGETVWIPG